MALSVSDKNDAQVQPYFQPKILMVDDRVENLAVLEGWLARLDAQLYRATSGNEALALALEHDFALALVDVQMPEMDGFELTELLHGSPKTEHLPIIFVSAIYSGDAFRVKGVEVGAIDFIEKPIVPEILLGKVRLFLELYLHRRNLLRESFRGIVEQVSDGVMLVDRQQKILLANPAADTLLGADSATLSGSRCAFPLTGSPRQEVTLMTDDGQLREVELHVSSMPWHGEEVHIVSMRDVTERRQTEMELKQAVKDLNASNAELQSFTYTVSHDLKSPLVTIGGFVGLLEMTLGDALTDDTRSFVREIKRATQNMGQLLDHLLSLSRIGRIKHPVSTVAISDLVAAVTKGLVGAHPARKIELRVADSLPSVTGDAVLLQQLLQNLVDNAVRYMGDQLQPLIEIGVADSPSGRALFVRDNGMGIPEQYQHKIFGLFERLSADTEGTGVGLALVRKIALLHNGDVWVESAGKGQGSTFWVKLPFVEEVVA